MPKIVVIVERGRVRKVDGIPPDVYIEVRNYDVDLLDQRLLSTDENGEPCQILEWRAPE